MSHKPAETWGKYRDHLQTVEDSDDRHFVKLPIHPWRDLMCGDCGVLPSQTNVCAGCGGYAEPVLNSQLMDKFKKSA